MEIRDPMITVKTTLRGPLAARSVAALLLLSAAVALASSPAPERVANGPEPASGSVDLLLEERWRRGGEDDDLFFGLVVDALVDDAGRILLLDSQLSEVIVLDADGEHDVTLGREGEGPGEFSRAGSLCWTPDGAVGVVQRFPGRIVKLSLDGTPAGTILPGDPTAGGRDMVSGAGLSPSGLVLCGAHMTRTETGRTRRSFLSLYGADGAPVVEYLGKNDVNDFTARSFHETDNDFVDRGRWTVLDGGSVAFAPERDRYVLRVLDPDGAPRLEITRPAEPPLRAAETLERLERRFSGSRMAQRTGVTQEFAATDPMIATMQPGPDGELWVLPTEGTRGRPDGVLQTWDVFDAAGRWDRRVDVRCPGDPEQDRLFLIDESRALLVSGFTGARDALTGEVIEDEDLDDAAPMEVILYDIRR